MSSISFSFHFCIFAHVDGMHFSTFLFFCCMCVKDVRLLIYHYGNFINVIFILVANLIQNTKFKCFTFHSILFLSLFALLKGWENGREFIALNSNGRKFIFFFLYFFFLVFRFLLEQPTMMRKRSKQNVSINLINCRRHAYNASKPIPKTNKKKKLCNKFLLSVNFILQQFSVIMECHTALYECHTMVSNKFWSKKMRILFS